MPGSDAAGSPVHTSPLPASSTTGKTGWAGASALGWVSGDGLRSRTPITGETLASFNFIAPSIPFVDVSATNFPQRYYRLSTSQ
jgi:hypothetical protein